MTTEQHLSNWIRNVYGQEMFELFPEDVEQAMLDIHNEDPEYWGNQGWSRILNEVRDRREEG